MFARFVENESGIELDPNGVVKKYARCAGWLSFFAWLLMASVLMLVCALLITLVYLFEKPAVDPIVVHENTMWLLKLTGVSGMLTFVFGFARWRYGKLIDQFASHWVIKVGSQRADYLVNYDPRWTIYCGRALPMIFPYKRNYFPMEGKVEWDTTVIADGVVTDLDIVVDYDLRIAKSDKLLLRLPYGCEQMEERIISDVNLGLSGRATANEELVFERGRILWPPENPFTWLTIKVTESEANPQTEANTPANWLTNDAEFI